jgi:hypothetical protein
MTVYAGSTPKYIISIKDENGVELNASDLNVITQVKIYIYNSLTGDDIGKFYLNAPAPAGTGWVQISLYPEDIKKVLLVLSAAHTSAAQGNANTIQINTHIKDAQVSGGERIVIKKGKFHEISPAHS